MRAWPTSLMLLTVAALLATGAVSQEAKPPSPTSPSPAPASGPTAPAPEPTPEMPAAEEPPAEETEAAEAEAKPAVLELIRSGQDGKDRVIRVERATVGDTSGMFTTCGPQEGEPEDAPTVAVFAESGEKRVTITIDKNRIEVPVAVVTQRNNPDGSSGDGSVEASAGTTKFLDDVPEGAADRLSKCAVEVKLAPTQDTVFVTQGKTQLKGQNLVYDETDGIARIDGPISFERVNDKEPLSGTSDRIDVNVDEETTTLIGNVVLTSKGGRVSKAARVEYDDTANSARLYGTLEQPAQSTKGPDVLSVTQGYLLYNLDTNDVVAQKDAEGNITGEFQDGETSEKK